ncbi:DNA internalization-related competence protein ComEC/Rec2 [Scleromatobacter humisilvae]|uniref:DNA internalization-related competence protein ComEC/Rec2 n=1 Tax=Scleromatobacter humisilvae TaxID=2897159 RepID=A0A9X1YL21_9BURK|nr:DNA internalization-related competence protein ComEC/Rec2 [Scleromatobacter humisilvae]MCK9686698.1 DNA internalization-related competence protein ComEC/Rec2 [Scleromatobacter humisilvae]
MHDDRTVTSSDAAGAWWRAAAALSWVGGVAWQLQQQTLWVRDAYPLIDAAALVMLLVALRRRWRVGICVAVATAGFGYAGWRADARLADALAPAWEGCDVELVGVIDDMPQLAQDGEHFAFVVESARALGMTSRELKRVRSLDVAAGRPLPDAVAQAEEAAARDHASSDGFDEDDDSPAAAAPSPGAGGPVVPSRVWLAWSRNQRDDRAVAASPAPLRAGQRWRLPVRLRRPHGAMNPDGFDAELWLFDQGLRATGTVRGNGQLLDTSWAPVATARQWVRDRLMLSAQSADDAAATGALAALAVGDQAAIDGPGWEVFRNTGVAHLMSISGLHITMLGWLGGAAVGAVWRRSERAALWLPTPAAARWGGVAVAWLYALLAGWGVPAQRTVLMLAATAFLRSAGLNWPASLVALGAMVPVTLLDPWALLQPGFWLSFAAVGLLMVSEPAREAVAARARDASPHVGARTDAGDGAVPTCASRKAQRPSPGWRAAALRFGSGLRRLGHGVAAELRGGVRAQVIASVGLAPLTLVAFEQLSLVGLLANLVAEPWVTLVVTPLTLLGVALPPLWQLAALALKPLLAFLAWLARWPQASVHVATAPGWALVAGLAGGALLMLPLPWRVRALGAAMLPPLLWPFVARPPPGRFELVAADVGQGTAVLVRTHAHLLLFDTGPRFGDDNDAGKRLLLPLMQARGEPRVDVLMLSHADADHVGGAQSIIDRMPVLALRSSLAADNPLRANPLPHVACEAGQGWSWDGVRFAILHPFASDYRPGAKTNALSCVLRVVGADGASALLTGDVEAPGEARLVARARGEPAAALRSDVLVVPHHGSHTSSTDAFLDAVRPQVAVIQVGYRSRYGHPAPEVVARYAAHGIPVVRTDHCGAWLWAGGGARCTRTLRRRYWQWQGTDEPSTPAWPGSRGPPPDP